MISTRAVDLRDNRAGLCLPLPFNNQLLKWIGNKQRYAPEIVSYFPADFKCYYEPFLGSGAVLATLAPSRAQASDIFKPLIEIWQMLSTEPETVKAWYCERWQRFIKGDKQREYEAIKLSYNCNPNGADLLFLCRACYGGVVRFRQSDGYMSTPCGAHQPIPPDSFSQRVDEWHRRVANTTFQQLDYREAMTEARRGDLIYCDPPYCYSQSILYRAQSFNLTELMLMIDRCRARGVYVALSIDGTKQSGDLICNLDIPADLFKREIFINCGRSMLKRFQMNGQTLEREIVADRLLLTY